MRGPLVFGVLTGKCLTFSMGRLSSGALVIVLLGFPSCTEKPTSFSIPPPNGGDTLVSFSGDVRPLFSQYGCASASCHGANPGQSNYSVLTYASVFRPGMQAAGRGLLPARAGRPDSSYLVWKVEGQGDQGEPINLVRMPQTGPPYLQPSEIALIRAWIRQGALDN